MMMEKIILVTTRKAIRAKRSNAGNGAMLAIEQKMKVQEMQRLHLGSRKRFHERESEKVLLPKYCSQPCLLGLLNDGPRGLSI